MANLFKRPQKQLPQMESGAVIFDTLNGKKEKYSDGTMKTLLGITGSRIYQFVGPTSTGKTSMAIDIAYRLIEPYPNGHIYLMDYEHGFEPIRIQQLTGLYIDEIADRFDVIEDIGEKHLMDTKREPIVVASIGKLVDQLVEFKNTHREALSTIIDGVATLEPTIIIIDSIAGTITDSQQEKSTSTNMTGAQRAKELGEVFNILNPKLADANITIFTINHLHEDVQTGLVPKAAMLRDLRQGETIPGGKGYNYLVGTNVVLRRGAKLAEDKLYGVDGNYMNMLLAKSRGAETGKVRSLIFEPKRGFLWDLSLFDYLIDNKKLEGGVKFTVPGYDKGKVSRKEAYELTTSNKDYDFIRALREYGKEVLSELIPEADTRPLTSEEEEARQAKIMSEFLDTPGEGTGIVVETEE